MFSVAQNFIGASKWFSASRKRRNSKHMRGRTWGDMGSILRLMLCSLTVDITAVGYLARRSTCNANAKQDQSERDLDMGRYQTHHKTA